MIRCLDRARVLFQYPTTGPPSRFPYSIAPRTIGSRVRMQVGPDGQDLEKVVGEAVRAAFRSMRYAVHFFRFSKVGVSAPGASHRHHLQQQQHGNKPAMQLNDLGDAFD